MFSDYAYLDLALSLLVALLFVVHRLWTTVTASTGLRAGSWQSIKRVELRSIAIWMLVLSMVLMIVYSAIAAWVKYREGFYVDPATQLIITRPMEKFSEKSRKLFQAIAILQNLSMTLQGSAVVLIMALWNHMSKAMLHKPFMSSWEFKAYAVYSLVSILVYPFLQVAYMLVRTRLVTTVVPIFLMCAQALVLVALTQITNSRFRTLLGAMRVSSAAQDRIHYYARMNNFLAVAFMLVFVGYAAIGMDAVTTDALYFNKMLLDVFSKLFVLGYCLVFPIAILILVPPTGDAEVSALRSPRSPQGAPSASAPNTGGIVRSPVIMMPPPAGKQRPSPTRSPRSPQHYPQPQPQQQQQQQQKSQALSSPTLSEQNLPLANRDTRGFFAV